MTPRALAFDVFGTVVDWRSPTLQANRYARLLAHAGIVSARTSEGEPNRPETTLRRPHRLQALAVGYDAGDIAAVLAYLQLAVYHGHWAILIFHEIVRVVVEEGQVSTAMHEQVLDAIASLPLWCAPVGRVFDHIARHTAPGSVTSVLS